MEAVSGCMAYLTLSADSDSILTILLKVLNPLTKRLDVLVLLLDVLVGHCQ